MKKLKKLKKKYPSPKYPTQAVLNPVEPVPHGHTKGPMERLEELEVTVAKLSERMEKMANAFNNHTHRFTEPSDDP